MIGGVEKLVRERRSECGEMLEVKSERYFEYKERFLSNIFKNFITFSLSGSGPSRCCFVRETGVERSLHSGHRAGRLQGIQGRLPINYTWYTSRDGFVGCSVSLLSLSSLLLLSLFLHLLSSSLSPFPPAFDDGFVG